MKPTQLISGQDYLVTIRGRRPQRLRYVDERPVIWLDGKRTGNRLRFLDPDTLDEVDTIARWVEAIDPVS